MPVIPTPNAAQRFDFPFDPALVADHPVLPRDQARLLVMERGEWCRDPHRRVGICPSYSVRRSGGREQYQSDACTSPCAGAIDGKCLDLLFVQDLGHNVWEVIKDVSDRGP